MANTHQTQGPRSQRHDRRVILIGALTRQGFFCWLMVKGSKIWHRLVQKKWRNCCGN